ncbi:hypothetical protein H105_00237 [Trichophyton soudanense CBS 452.61]|uniref:Uncharacterized protein n=1 Tax=Trichophyton soudanense CBS 452.61 TaxID=1215331 RepID=A0A022Y752_TRISD|nr:hypothetical protein H105_00237 [Trichophyton soudanense CBS 452.61]
MKEFSTINYFTEYHTPPQPIVEAAVDAARGGRVEDLASLVKDYPNLKYSIFVNRVAISGKGGISTYQVLVDSGCNINISYGYGGSPLIYAIYHKKFPLARHLLSLRVNPNINNLGIYLAPLGVAVSFRPEFVVDLLDAGLLLDRGADVNEVTKYPFYAMVGFYGGSPPMYWAVQGGHMEVVTLLLQYLVCLDMVDENGLTPAERANKRGFEAAKDALRRHESIKHAVTPPKSGK